VCKGRFEGSSFCRAGGAGVEPHARSETCGVRLLLYQRRLKPQLWVAQSGPNLRRKCVQYLSLYWVLCKERLNAIDSLNLFSCVCVILIFVNCSANLTVHVWLILKSRIRHSYETFIMIRYGNIFGSVLMSQESFTIAIIVITLRIVPRYHNERHLAVHPLRFPHYKGRNDCL
jgi:hypothetical protein